MLVLHTGLAKKMDTQNTRLPTASPARKLIWGILYAIVFVPIVLPSIHGTPYPMPVKDIFLMRIAVAFAVGACVLLIFDRRLILASIMLAFYLVLIIGGLFFQ